MDYASYDSLDTFYIKANRYSFLLDNGQLDISWMTIGQKRLYNVLINNKDVSLSVHEIITKAGYKNISIWYRALEDKKYQALLEYLGLDRRYIALAKLRRVREKQEKIIFDTLNLDLLDTSWMTTSQQRIFNIIKHHENRNKGILEICNLAGYKAKIVWYRNLSDEKYRYVVKSLGFDISEIEQRYTGDDNLDLTNLDSFDTSWMSKSQKKFFDILKIDENRGKPIKDIISLAGFNTDSTWRRAKLSQRFRNLLNKFGINVTYKMYENGKYDSDDLSRLCEIYGYIDLNNLDEYDTTWMSRVQRNVFQVLKDPNNRNKRKKEIASLAGYTPDIGWSQILSSEKYRYLLTLMGVRINSWNEENNLESYEIVKNIDFHDLDKIDTSWMTVPQRKFFDLLKNPENISLTARELCKKAGYKKYDSWYKSLRSDRFANLIIMMGVEIQSVDKPMPRHDEIVYISNPNERLQYLERDIWDIRVLFKEYPLHNKPNRYKVDFNIIESLPLRKTIKRYFSNMLVQWKPLTFRNKLYLMSCFFGSLYKLFPSINGIYEISRTEHIEPVIQAMACECSTHIMNGSLNAVRGMLNYMYINRWDDGPPTNTLIIDYDIPVGSKKLPRPIPPNVKNQLDEYLEEEIIPLLENNQSTPIIDPTYWDMLIVLRYTGRRYEDLSHLISDDSDRDCLRYDSDGDPQLYTDHRIAKIEKDIVIPLAHLKGKDGKNIVEQAILRQKQRVKDIPPVSVDGFKYLFRRIKTENQYYAVDNPLFDKYGNIITETIGIDYFSHSVILKVCNNIPLRDENNNIYNISCHQFRHTVATEMIDAGIDIYAVKEFLGHSSVAMTERYIKVYQQRLKKEITKKLGKSSEADSIAAALPERNEVYDSKWVKNRIIGVFELGDGCCEHPYKMSSCPHLVSCKICFKRKVRPDHKERVIETLDSYTINRNQFMTFGLNERAEECDKIIQFYTIALEIISSNQTFDPKIHLPKDFY